MSLIITILALTLAIPNGLHSSAVINGLMAESLSCPVGISTGITVLVLGLMGAILMAESDRARY